MTSQVWAGLSKRVDLWLNPLVGTLACSGLLYTLCREIYGCTYFNIQRYNISCISIFKDKVDSSPPQLLHLFLSTDQNRLL
jgi:hypothetical protein